MASNYRILNQFVDTQLLTSLWKTYHRWLSDIKLNQTAHFSALYSWIKPRFTAGNEIEDSEETRGHHNKTIVASIVYRCKVHSTAPRSPLNSIIFILVIASAWDPRLNRATPVLIYFSSCGQRSASNFHRRSASNFHRVQTADHRLASTTASPPTAPNRPLPAPACLPSNAAAVRRLVARMPRPIWPYSIRIPHTKGVFISS